MKLSVIITNYKTLDPLKLCVRSVLGQRTSFDMEVIVADIEADFENRQLILEEFPGIVYLPIRENCGFSKAINSALKISKGEFKMIMNADIAVKDPDVFEKMVSLASRDPKIGIVGPALLNFDGSVQSSCFRYYTPATIVLRRSFLKKFGFAKKNIDRFLMREELARREFPAASVEADWLMGAALFFQKGFFEKVGGFDERFFMYFEDVDIAKRAHNAGYRVVYFPEVRMYHYHQKVSQKKGGIADLFYNRYGRVHLLSGVKYFMKHGIKN